MAQAFWTSRRETTAQACKKEASTRGVSRSRLSGVLDEPCLLVNVLQVLYDELKRGQGLV